MALRARAVLLVVGCVLAALLGPAASSLAGPPKPPPRPDARQSAENTRKSVNSKQAAKAQNNATADVVRKMIAYRNQGYVYGAARDCRASVANGTTTCQSTMYLGPDVAGTAYLVVYGTKYTATVRGVRFAL